MWLLCASSVVLLIIIVVVTTRSSTEQLLELVEFNLARAILVDLSDQFLDVNRHLELLLDGSDEHVSVDTATTVFVTTHCNICVEQISSGCALLVFSLRGNQLLELVKAQRTKVVGVRLRNHAEYLLVRDPLAELLKRLLEICSGHGALLFQVELHEALPDLGALFSLGLLLLLFGQFDGNIVFVV